MIYHTDLPPMDENTSSIYEKDDIRLCTIQRAIPEQKLGFSLCYHRKERFHYLKFYGDWKLSLAYRSGIKNFDRIISLNGVNIEKDTQGELGRRFDIDQHLPVQMLVCSPATYVHYRSTGKLLHSDLLTVQYLKPIYATSILHTNADTPELSHDNESFCVVQWENSNIVSTIPQSAIFKSPEFTSVNDICFIETDEHYRKGRIILKDSSRDHSVGCADDKSIFSLDGNTRLFSQKSSQNPETDIVQVQFTIQDKNNDTKVIQNTDDVQCIQDRVYTTLEEFPNELFFYLFTFIDIQHLYNAFWGLNSRLNNIFLACQNISLTYDEKVNPLLMTLYAPYVNRLIIQTSIDLDFSQFPNLHTLILCNRNSKYLQQIQSKMIPNLIHLSFLLGSRFIPPRQLICDVFSNKFPTLRQVNLGCIDESTCNLWTTSPSLKFVSILSCKPMSVLAILASCPNLHHLQVHVLYKNNNTLTSFPLVNHALRRLTLWSDYTELTFNDIDNILTYTPNVEHLYLQTVYSTPFIHLTNGLINRLHHLSRFDCYIKEILTGDDRISTLHSIHRIHPCFNRIKCLEENGKFRMFATE
ncbi:unnamed protein product [Rotaria sp. Silwood2]|nr:unnamed protein product [Rotaria sp. Silwood2]CAF4473898.1 unnamed protein product [Rotaria sp. Silwood2]CAF4499461.1 unnamed protein product [Rotaria sp. Silwood2]CAF4549753.1 unnamed protein product [Rotaria sp. Silwood2]